MIGSIPFGIPEQFAAGMADGSVLRFGALLKDAGSGQILGHIQETGLAHRLLDGVLSTPFTPVGVAGSLASNIASNVQLSQLTILVEGLEVLQFATLGASVAGIGVSAVGFYLMNKKLNRIQSQISDLSQRVDKHFWELRERDFRAHYSKIHGLYVRADDAISLKHPESEWRQIAALLSDESAFFHGEMVHLLEQKEFDKSLFSSLITSYGICNAGRTECLLLAGEMQAAAKAADTIAQHYTLFDQMNPLGLKSSSGQTLSGTTNLLSGVRDAQDAAFTKPFLIETLIEKSINGREYVTALREEDERPLLVLDAT